MLDGAAFMHGGQLKWLDVFGSALEAGGATMHLLQITLAWLLTAFKHSNSQMQRKPTRAVVEVETWCRKSCKCICVLAVVGHFILHDGPANA